MINTSVNAVPEIRGYRMEPLCRMSLFISELDRVNKEFYQFDVRQLDEKIEKIEKLIKNYRNVVPFSANDEVEKKLYELSEKVVKFNDHSKSAKCLSAEIESLAKTVFMPVELIEMIGSSLARPEKAKLSSTSCFYREIQMVNLSAFFQMMFDRVVEDAEKSFENDEIKGNYSLTPKFLEIISAFNMEKAKALASSLDPHNDGMSCGMSWEKILKKVIEVNLQEAVDLAGLKISGLFHRKQVFCAAVRALAKNDVEQALALAASFEHLYVRAFSLGEVADILWESDPGRSKVIFRQAIEVATQIPSIDRDFALRSIIAERIPLDLEMALEAIDHVESDDIRRSLIIDIAVAVMPYDLEKSLKMVGDFKKISLIEQICLIPALKKVDEEKAKELLKEVWAAELERSNKDDLKMSNVLYEVATSFANIDLPLALEVLKRLEGSARDVGWSQISEQLVWKDFPASLRFAEEIKGGEIRDRTFGGIVYKLLPDRLSDALLAAGKMKGNLKDRFYGDIAVVMSKSDMDQALRLILENIRLPQVKAVVFTKIALQCSYDNPNKAKELIMEAFTLMQQVNNLRERFDCQIKILKSIQDALAQ